MSIFATSRRQGPLSDRLRARGYALEEAHLDGRLIVRMTAPSGRVWTTGKNMNYPMNSQCVHLIADNKHLSYTLAHKLSIQAPQSIYVERAAVAMDICRSFLMQHDRVIVKPLDSYKSRGVTLNITTEKELQDALQLAFKESPTAIIQQQVRGEEYRFTVLHGKVMSVLRRERPQVVGDGTSSIRQLVAHENDARKTLRQSGIDYPQWTKALVGDDVESDEVVEAGVERILASTTLVSRGASVYELSGEADSSYGEMAERFASEIGAGLCAVDMFILDHTQPATPGNYWFNECNASPALKMYTVVRNADSSWIADAIVEATDKYLNIT